MAYTNCLQDGRKHNWDYWRPLPERVLESGELGVMSYKRECQNMGCASYELAESLEPKGLQRHVEAFHDGEGKTVILEDKP